MPSTSPQTKTPTSVEFVRASPVTSARPVVSAKQKSSRTRSLTPAVQAPQPVVTTDAAAGASSQAVSAGSSGIDEKASLDYVSALRAAIDQLKEYPALARARNQTGRVEVGFTIEKDGKINSIHLVQRSDFEILNRAAEAAIRKLNQFKPVPDNVSPGALEVTVPLRFSLSQ